jgi:Xaa-Pro dipeptidase
LNTFIEFRDARAKSISQKQNVDVIILSQPENIQYYSGFFPAQMTILNSTESYLVFNPSNGQMGLITSASDVPTILEGGYDKAIYPLGTFKFYLPNMDEFSSKIDSILSTRFYTANEALYAALNEISPLAKTIAIDESRMPFSTWAALQSRLINAKMVSGTQLINEIKSVKHASEIELLREAANIAEDCLYSVISEIHLDMSEYDIEMAYRVKVTAKECNPYFCVATIDKRAAFSDTANLKSSKVKDGSVIRFDYGCIHEGYRSDMARTVIVGCNRKAEDYYSAILEGEKCAIAAVKPGVSAGEIYDIALNATRMAGIKHYERHHVGHGIGIAIYDLPSLTANNPALLEKDMVLCVETPYYEIGWGGVQVEDTIVVTASGAEYLSNTSRELIKIDR